VKKVFVFLAYTLFCFFNRVTDKLRICYLKSS